MNTRSDEDPRLADALRQIEEEPALDERTRDELHRSIMAGAGPGLARLRRGAWWDWAAGWARFAVPAAAVAILLVILLLPDPLPVLTSEVVAEDSGPATSALLTSLVSGELPEKDAVDLLMAGLEENADDGSGDASGE